MAIYALWNNKGGVGKSYLTFQIASEYARTHPDERVLVIDLCPQANSSVMLLGGMGPGDTALDGLANHAPRRTISGYIEDRIRSPYVSPATGATYVVRPRDHNRNVPQNLHLIPGDEQLEIQGARVLGATFPGPPDAWRSVHTWVSDLIADVRQIWNVRDTTVFVDCNPSFSIYTELALSASDRLIIPFSADGSSKRAVRAVLALLYGVMRQPGAQQSQFFVNSNAFRLPIPKIYCYVGNRLTQYVTSAKAFRTVVNEIGDEIWAVWQTNAGVFQLHPAGSPVPQARKGFKEMFQFEIVDANTASVVSGALGIPIVRMASGNHDVAGRRVMVNQSQLEKQHPNIQALVAAIE